MARETLRLYPTGPFVIRRTKDEVVLNEAEKIPAGADVFLFTWFIQREASGVRDPLEFRPQRWIDDTPKNRVDDDNDVVDVDIDDDVDERTELVSSASQKLLLKKNNLVFGYGARSCLGNHLAILELEQVIERVTREFRIEPVNLDLDPEKSFLKSEVGNEKELVFGIDWCHVVVHPVESVLQGVRFVPRQ